MDVTSSDSGFDPSLRSGESNIVVKGELANAGLLGS